MSDKAESREETREMEDIKREEMDDLIEEELARQESGEKPVVENDEDDDDDDDDEDSDEDVAPRKRARRERNRFVDVEAEVSDDDEDDDEEDDELIREGFIAPAHGEEDEPAAGADDRLHRQLDSNMNKTSEEDAQKLADEFRQRYGRSSSKRFRAETQDGFVPQRFMLPSVEDAVVWCVRCRPTREIEIVKKLLKKKLTLDSSPNPLKISSVFQRDNYPGRIYIEAKKAAAVDQALNGLQDVYLNQKIMVPVQEIPLLLKPSKSSQVALEVGSYVRIKRGIYKGDLAIVDQISENNLEVMLQVVPRLDYGKSDTVDPRTGNKRKKAPSFANRPSSRLFNAGEALKYDSINLVKKDSKSYAYRGDDYIDGYLYKSFKVQFVETNNISPTVEELTLFGSRDDGPDLTQISQTLKKNQAGRFTFQPGDRVEVLSGEQKGLLGDVTNAQGDIVTVRAKQLNLEFPASSLRKVFVAGDHVSVISGEHLGDAGLVLAITNGQVTFVSDQTHKNLTISANNLSKSIDSTPTSSEYGVHDIVELSAHSVACVIKAGHDIFTVLDENDKVLQINKNGILSIIRTDRLPYSAIDAKNNEIKIGDTVVEKHGARREGTVLYIQKRQLFIVSKEIQENAGVFLANPTNVYTVASKDGPQAVPLGLDLTKMNPNMLPPKKTATAAARPMGRDKCLNMHVSIRAGPYKGTRGIVKDTNGDMARVEFHTRNKHIFIDKRKLLYFPRRGDDASNDVRGLTYDELVTRGGGRDPSFSSNRTNNASHSGIDGGKTPAWSSGNRSTYGFDGGKTPAVRSGTESVHGTASAWGGASSWGVGGGASTWGAGGGASAWGGAGNTSTWGANSQHGGTSQHGGASAWGAGNASQHGGNASAWGSWGGQSTRGGSSAWGEKKDGSSSAWGQ